MNSFLYDLKRIFTGSFTIIIIVLLVIVTMMEAYGTVGSVNSAVSPPSSTSIYTGMQSSISGFYALLIPLFGIFSAYFYYGKDKTSGILESIISKPVTKGRLFLSRFLGTSLTFVMAITLAIGLADILIYKYTGSFLSDTGFLSIVIGYSVVAIGYSGLMYLIAQFAKSSDIMIGSGLGLLFILGFFWGILMYLLLIRFLEHASFIKFQSILIYLNSISPSNYSTIMEYLKEGSYKSIINVGIVAGIGIIWILVPAFISFMLARSRD